MNVAKYLFKFRPRYFSVAVVLTTIAAMVESLMVGTVGSLIYIFSSGEMIVFGEEVNARVLSSYSILLVLFFIIAAMISLTSTWFNSRFAAEFVSDSVEKIYRGITSIDLHKILFENSTNFVKICTVDSNRVLGGTLVAYFNLISKLVLLLIILVGLFIFNWRFTLGISLSLLVVYAVIYLLTSNRLITGSVSVSDGLREVSRCISETVRSGGDIRVYQSFEIFIPRLKRAFQSGFFTQANNAALIALPRFIVESCVFIGLVVGLVFLRDENWISQLAIYGVSAMKIIPAVQQIFSSVSLIQSNADAFRELVTQRDIFSELPPRPNRSDESIEFERVIELRGIRYEVSGSLILNDVNFTLEAGGIVGIVGRSGSGKSTLVKVLLGLFRNYTGQINVDGRLVDSSVIVRYSRLFGYVSQESILIDCSIYDNVVFGRVDDPMQFWTVIRSLQLVDEISSLPGRERFVVGEDGKHLSGGQRQRILLARALYGRPRVLVLDEFTSALDANSETAVLNVVRELPSVTVVMISHRKEPLEICQKIYSMDLN
jgi:ABC-type bacteriocin/lantibiotic exporter with double-glycine peptidase domain